MVGGGEGLEAKAQVMATLLELSPCKAQAGTSTIETIVVRQISTPSADATRYSRPETALAEAV